MRGLSGVPPTNIMEEVFFMEPAHHRLPEAQQNNDIAFITTQKLPEFRAASIAGTLEWEPITASAPAK